MDVITNRLLRQAVPLFNVFAGVLLILVLGALLSLGKDVFIPLAVALLLSFALSPVTIWLQRIGLGKGPAVVMSVLLAIAVVLGLSILAYDQMADLASQIPAHKEVVKIKLQSLSGSLFGGGPFSRASEVASEILAEISKLTDGKSVIALPPIVVKPEDASSIKVAADALAHLVHPLAVTFAVLLLTGFMLGQREDIRNRLIKMAGTEDLQQTTAALDDAGDRLGKLLLTQLMVNASFGLVIGLALWWIGLPSPFLWGLLAGTMRFVPYVGALIGAAAPLLVAFIFDPGWSDFIFTAAVFLALDLTVGHVIEPLLYGHSTGLSPLAVVISATIWAFLWGPIGLVLSTPLTICLVVLGRYIPRLNFLAILLGDRPPLEPHETLYQRLLAGDPVEASQQAKAFLQKRSLATYYDEVALAAVRRAHTDIVRGSVKGERVNRVVDTARRIIASLQAPKARSMSLPWRRSLETADAIDRFQDDTATQQVIAPDALPEAWRGAHPVAIVYGAHPLDEVPARMLAQVCERYGLRAKVVAMADCELVSHEAQDQVQLLFLSFVEPLSTLHLRAASIQVRGKIAGARVVLCIWQEADRAMIEKLRSQLRFDNIVTTTVSALKELQGFMAPAGKP